LYSYWLLIVFGDMSVHILCLFLIGFLFLLLSFISSLFCLSVSYQICNLQRFSPIPWVVLLFYW
jgi:hypothetical protein